MGTINLQLSPIRHSKAIRHAESNLEKRIFMFIDMKSSTSIAEQIGTEDYFYLLQDYFEVLLESIANYAGEVYQIIGDEVVLTWSSKDKAQFFNPIKCYKAMKKSLEHSENEFLHKYRVVPDFKASIHYGEVIVSNWSFNNKERVFIGDVLNTASRILSYCKHINEDLLISGAYHSQLPAQKQDFQHTEQVILRGKTKTTDLYSYCPSHMVSVLRQVS